MPPQPEVPPLNLTEQHLLYALLNLVGDLAKKMTGETPILCLEDDAGNILHVAPGNIQWCKAGEKVACVIHDERYFKEHHREHQARCMAARPPATAPAP